MRRQAHEKSLRGHTWKSLYGQEKVCMDEVVETMSEI